MSKTLRVLYMAAEADPFVKVGGLGDVAGSLPGALRRLPAAGQSHPDVDIRLILPLYPGIRDRFPAIEPLAQVAVSHASGPMIAEAFQLDLDGLIVYLIAGPPISDEGPVYSGDPIIDGNKFIFFSLASLELMRHLKWRPDILHANDWHTAPAVYWIHTNKRKDAFFSKTATILQVHNLPYLGQDTQDAMGAFGLVPARGSTLPHWAQHLPLPLGLLAADRILTVSPGYAEEMLTPEFGSGLDEYLRSQRSRIGGILNGIEPSDWDPATDQDLYEKYSAKDLTRRLENKHALQAELGLALDQNAFLLGMVTRMVHQKGVDMVLEAIPLLNGLNWHCVILGTGERPLEAASRRLQEQFPDRMRAEIRYDGALSRRIYAGSDALLIPSRYEPCGLTQMIAMRYGSVPIARATGGLRDTIPDYSVQKDSTGFLFDGDDGAAVAEAVRRAAQVFGDKRRWRALQRRGMKKDFSWDHSARRYQELYAALAETN